MRKYCSTVRNCSQSSSVRPDLYKSRSIWELNVGGTGGVGAGRVILKNLSAVEGTANAYGGVSIPSMGRRQALANIRTLPGVDGGIISRQSGGGRRQSGNI